MVQDAIVGIILIAAFGAFIYGPWQWICTDIARQIVFEQRDAIFDMAREGKLSFESAQYRKIRRSLEKTIRYAHELTLPKFLYFFITMKLYERTKPSDLMLAIRDIKSPEIRKEVEEYVDEALRAIVLMMLIKSPVFMLIIFPVTFWIRGTFSRAKVLIQSEAEEVDDLRYAS